METLFSAYRGIDKSVWDYYDGFRTGGGTDNPFITHPDSVDSHRQFIREYFRLSGKLEVLMHFGQDLLYEERAFHTNSVFFLGLLIRENTVLKSILFNAKRSELNYPIFPLLWFLSILFHDYAMMIEDKSRDFPMLSDLEGVYTHYNIEHSLLEHMPKGINGDLFGHIERYYAYRSGGSGGNKKKVDHGILAGIFLYDRLVKIRREKWRLRANEKLSWHNSLEKRYALAASAVACHNIWTIPPTDPNVPHYTDKGLNYLVQPMFQEISLQNFPLLFLFGIADTIDPIKLYMRDIAGGLMPEVILKNIEVYFTKKSIHMRNVAESPLDFKHLIKNAKGLIGWMAVEIIDGADHVTIAFK